MFEAKQSYAWLAFGKQICTTKEPPIQSDVAVHVEGSHGDAPGAVEGVALQRKS